MEGVGLMHLFIREEVFDALIGAELQEGISLLLTTAYLNPEYVLGGKNMAGLCGF